MPSHFFASSGEYGDASGLVIFDTAKWTDDDWEKFGEVWEGDRPEAARKIHEWIEAGRQGELELIEE